MDETTREGVALAYEVVADELARAVAHLRTTARHFRAAEVPRGCAHAWAAYGHVRRAQVSLDALAGAHAERAAR